MSPVVIVILAVLGAALIAGLVVVLVSTLARGVARKMEAAIRDRFPPEQIRRSHAFANYFGRSSLGAGQVRGNGALVLTDEVLWFQLAVPTREVSLPLASITAVESRRSHLGKGVGRELLYIEAEVDERSEGFAWLVDDLPGWRRDLDDLLRRESRDVSLRAEP